jgi:hypothetical protein
MRSIIMRERIIAAAIVALTGALTAHAQSPAPGWTLIVRIVPNPLPIGRCAGVTEEVQDDQGYRRNELSNGGVIDFHKFRYDADTTNFQWQNGDPLNGAICARPTSLPSNVTVTITLPDGLAGSVDLSSIAPGQSAAPVQYARQAPLKRPGVPPPHASSAGTAASTPTTTGGMSGSAAAPASASAGISAGGAGRSLPVTPSRTTSTATTPGIVTTPALSMIGAFAPSAPISVTTDALSMTGAYSALGAMSFDTPALTMMGNYAPMPSQVVTTDALSMTGGFAPLSSQLVTTPALSMVGGYATFAPQTVVTSALVMIGSSGP